MLIRTSRDECKSRVALAVRVALFLGIPAAYFVFSCALVAVTGPTRDPVDINFFNTGTLHANQNQ